MKGVLWSMNMHSHLALMAHCLSSELGFIMKTLQIAWSLCGSGGRLGGGLTVGGTSGVRRQEEFRTGVWAAEFGAIFWPSREIY